MAPGKHQKRAKKGRGKKLEGDDPRFDHFLTETHEVLKPRAGVAIFQAGSDTEHSMENRP